MAIARICAPLPGARESKAVASVACGLAKRFRSRVSGCYVRMPPEPYAHFASLGGSSTLQGSLLAVAIPDEIENLAQARQVFETACRRFELSEGADATPPSCAWGGDIAGPHEFGSAARLNDLIVVARPGTHTAGNRADVLDAALFRARRSILIVSDRTEEIALQSVGIAYDGSAEAARAVTCALPFLREAKQVNVLTVGRVVKDAPTAKELIGYLASHGVSATHRPALEVSSSIGNTLLGVAQVFDTDLLVMGCPFQKPDPA